jgi:hypothetical protein
LLRQQTGNGGGQDLADAVRDGHFSIKVLKYIIVPIFLV